MEYSDYMICANSCACYAEAEAIINAAADDMSISARQYETIRYAAIRSAHESL